MYEDFFPILPLFDLSWLATSKNMKCLIVDDEDSVKLVMAKILYRIDEDMDLTYARNLPEATAALEACKYDLVIADYMLDESGTGMDLWHHCTKRYPRLPLILISSRTLGQIERDSRSHIVGLPFLQKPIEPGECRSLIESLI